MRTTARKTQAWQGYGPDGSLPGPQPSWMNRGDLRALMAHARSEMLARMRREAGEAEPTPVVVVMRGTVQRTGTCKLCSGDIIARAKGPWVHVAGGGVECLVVAESA